ncbi:hypothetical protein ACR77J_07850 [Tissierella praeacuta]|uniref:hypothetical protein n=1 Tax=Tissierella praeacuta TaxID=43131 RepID=UPI003DA227DA
MLDKIEQIRKWLNENQNKNIWIKQFANNIGVDIMMDKGYRLQEPIDEHFLVANMNNKDTIDIILFDTDKDKIRVGYSKDTFSMEALDFEADFEIELEHCLILFILQ